MVPDPQELLGAHSAYHKVNLCLPYQMQLKTLSETFIKQLPNGDKLKKKYQEYPVADLHILQKKQNVTVLFLREEFNFTVIVEKILLQTATKIDANAKSREFKK